MNPRLKKHIDLLKYMGYRVEYSSNCIEFSRNGNLVQLYIDRGLGNLKDLMLKDNIIISFIEWNKDINLILEESEFEHRYQSEARQYLIDTLLCSSE